MDFILYSDINEKSVGKSLGTPEYSYYFVLKAYRPALEALGGVHVVSTLSEVDPLYRKLKAQGIDCLLLAFTPPHRAPIDLACPTLCVVAWEYDSIPDQPWEGDPRNDWRTVFARHGGAVSLSRHTETAIKAAMGQDFPVLALPTPLWERFAEQRTGNSGDPVTAPTRLEIKGCIIDSRTLGLSADSLAPPAPPQENDVQAQLAPAVAAPIERPSWGRRWVITKHYLLTWYREAVQDLLPARLQLGKAGTSPEPSARWELPDVSQVAGTEVDGVVYVSVFNPEDGRKNWEQMITAFCWAFRDTPDATLVLKITQHDLSTYYPMLTTLLAQLSPFQCRVIALHGYLDDQQFARLHEATSYYVNASRCEGLCLPLMEFLACGKPAIAPAHTAMEDYISSDLAFVLRASREHSVWPHDPRILYRTVRYRPDWGSLQRAYNDSYRVAKQEPETYRAMSAAAQRKMESFASRETFQQRLSAFLATRRRPAAAAVADADKAGQPSC